VAGMNASDGGPGGTAHGIGHGTGSDSDNSLGTAEDGRVYDFICVVGDALFKKKINNVMSKNRGMTQVRERESAAERAIWLTESIPYCHHHYY